MKVLKILNNKYKLFHHWKTLLWCLCFLESFSLYAGVFEFSGGLGYSRKNYTDGSYQWKRQYRSSLGYYFFENSALEISYTYVKERVFIKGYQDITFLDKIYSVSWLQSFFGRRALFQPYFKIGMGQLNRTATGVYVLSGSSPPAQLDSLTTVLSLGTRMRLSYRFSIRIEGTSYIEGVKFSTWRDNVGLNLGASFYF